MKNAASSGIDLRPVLNQRIHRSQKRLDTLLLTADIDHVHNFRVAARELWVCKPLLKTLGATKPWHKSLRKAHRSLNALRDAQQMLVRIGNQHALTTALEAHIQHLTSRWQTDCPNLMDAGFFAALQESASKLPSANPNQLLDVWLLHWHRTNRQLMHRLSKAQATNLHSLHRLRMRYKKWRYLLELLIEAGAPLPTKLPEAMKIWQEKLGGIEDYRVMALLADKLHATPDCVTGFSQEAGQQAEIFMVEAPLFLQFIKRQQQVVRAVKA